MRTFTLSRTNFSVSFVLSQHVANFTHLLLTLRWSQDLPINYKEWLITIINDCFYFFLKSNPNKFPYLEQRANLFMHATLSNSLGSSLATCFWLRETE